MSEEYEAMVEDGVLEFFKRRLVECLESGCSHKTEDGEFYCCKTYMVIDRWNYSKDGQQRDDFHTVTVSSDVHCMDVENDQVTNNWVGFTARIKGIDIFDREACPKQIEAAADFANRSLDDLTGRIKRAMHDETEIWRMDGGYKTDIASLMNAENSK